MAARTRASIEAKQHEGKPMLLAFLDRTNFYERARHALAKDRALGTGLAMRVANMEFDMYTRGPACEGAWGRGAAVGESWAGGRMRFRERPAQALGADGGGQRAQRIWPGLGPGLGCRGAGKGGVGAKGVG